MNRAEECNDGCQWAKEVGVWPEHSCAGECEYLARRDEAEPYPGQAPCPACFESSGYMSRTISATWYEPAWEDTDYSRRCEHCNGTGTVEAALVTLDDFEELAFEEAETRARGGS